MHFALVADTFYPERNSASVLLRDLSYQLISTGHKVTVFVPSSLHKKPINIEWMDGVRIVRIKSFGTRDRGYFTRTLSELTMPFLMIFRLYQSSLIKEKWNGILWYSPSIFHGPFVGFFKKKSGCKAYLIIRDIFPEWAVDIGLMSRSLPFWFFSLVAKYQYSVADVIGVQSPGNYHYFSEWQRKTRRILEVLPNWHGKTPTVPCSIQLNKTSLSGRKIFVYAGNMGIAQGINILLNLAIFMRNRSDVGFLFVGRGSCVAELKKIVENEHLDNVLFFDEINSDEIPNLYSQCAIGLVALDHRHKSHNIPGKFISYIQYGLPVLASVNPGNDLAQIIRNRKIGRVCESNQPSELLHMAEELLDQIETDSDLPDRCKRLFEQEFDVKRAAQQIVNAFRV